MEVLDFRDVLAQMQKNLECAICLELLTNPVSTKCDHQFCRFCITHFLQNKRSVLCPLCKLPVTKRSLQERSELSNIVSNVKKLIVAFETDTGERFTPSKGPQKIVESIPENLYVREDRSSRRKLADQFNENARKGLSRKANVSASANSRQVSQSHFGEHEESVDIFYKDSTPTPVDTPASSGRKSSFSSISEHVPDLSAVPGKLNQGRPSKMQSDFKTTSAEFKKTCTNIDNKLDQKAVITRSRTRNRQEASKTEDMQTPNKCQKKRTFQRHGCGEDIKSEEEQMNISLAGIHSQNADSLSETGRHKESQQDKSHHTRKDKVDDLNIRKSTNDVSGKRQRVARKCQSRLEEAKSVQCKITRAGETRLSMPCVEQHAEIMKYLEEGSCGAVWAADQETGSSKNKLTHNTENIYGKDSKEKDILLHVGEKESMNLPIATNMSVENSVKEIGCKIVKHDSIDEIRYEPSDSIVPLSPVKPCALKSQANEVLTRKAIKREIAQQGNMNEHVIVEKLSSLPLETLSPASDVSSVSSTQQLMKPVLPVSRTYSREMKNTFQSDHVRNWANTLPQVGSIETHNTTLAQGSTTKDKINAKKNKGPKNYQSLKNVPVSAESVNGGLIEKPTGMVCAESTKDTSSSSETLLTLLPRRKFIFRSEVQNPDVKRTKVEGTVEADTDEDPYEFIGGLTPITHKRKGVKDRTSEVKTDGVNFCTTYDGNILIPTATAKKICNKTKKNVRFAINISQENYERSENIDFLRKNCSDTAEIGTQKASGHQLSLLSSKHVYEENKLLGESSVEKATEDDIVSIKNLEQISSNLANNSSENLHVQVQENTTEIPAGTRDRRERRNKMKLSEDLKIPNVPLPSGGKPDKRVQRKSSAKRRDQKQEVLDGETFSQKSSREMVQLIQKISEAEDYELMFSTQEAQRNMQEEQMKECNPEETFSSEEIEMDKVMETDTSSKQQHGQVEAREYMRKTESNPTSVSDTVKNSAISAELYIEESECSHLSVSETVENEAVYVRKQRCRNETAIQTEEISAGRKDKNLNTEKIEPNKIPQTVTAGEKDWIGKLSNKDSAESMKGTVVMKDSNYNKNMSEMVNSVINSTNTSTLFTSPYAFKQSLVSANRRLMTSATKDGICSFSRPNFSEMIQVFPGHECKSPFRKVNAGDNAGIVAETPDLRASFDVTEASQPGNKKMEADIVGVQESKQTSGTFSLRVTVDSSHANNAVSPSQSQCVKAPAMSTETQTIASYSLDDEYVKASVQPAQLTLKSKDLFKFQMHPHDEARTCLAIRRDHRDVVFALDTCIDDMMKNTSDKRESRNNLLQNSLPEEQESLTQSVIPETMDFDTQGCSKAKSRNADKEALKRTPGKPIKLREKSLESPKLNSCSAGSTKNMSEIVVETHSQSNQLTHLLDTAECNISSSQPEKEKLKLIDPSSQESYIEISSGLLPGNENNVYKSLETVADSTGQSLSIFQAPTSIKHLEVDQATNSSPRNSSREFVSHKMSLLSPNSSADTVRRQEVKTIESSGNKDPVTSEMYGHSPQVNNTVSTKHLSRKRKSLHNELTQSLVKIKSKPVSSAPTRLCCSDSEDDSVLIVRRSKRKCLSLDSSVPMKPVLFASENLANSEDIETNYPNIEKNIDEGISESEAMLIIETCTESELRDDVSAVTSIPAGNEVDCNGCASAVETEIDEAHEIGKDAAPVLGEHEEKLTNPQVSLVEVTPVGKLQYINSSGRYVIDFNDLGPSSQDDSTKNEKIGSLSQRCLFPAESETAGRRDLASNKQECILPEDLPGAHNDDLTFSKSKHNSNTGMISKSGSTVNVEGNKNLSDICKADSTSNNGVNFSEENERKLELIEHDTEKPSAKSNTSDASLTKKRTKRGLASKRHYINVDSLPHHPLGKLSPALKTVIFNGRKSSSNLALAKSSVGAKNSSIIVNVDTVDVVNEVAEGELAVGSSVKKTDEDRNTSIIINVDIVDIVNEDKEGELPVGTSVKETEEDKGRTEVVDVKMNKKKHSEEHKKKTSKFLKRKRLFDSQDCKNSYDYEKKQLERELFGQVSRELKALQCQNDVGGKRQDQTCGQTRSCVLKKTKLSEYLQNDSDEVENEMVSFDLVIISDNEVDDASSSDAVLKRNSPKRRVDSQTASEMPTAQVTLKDQSFGNTLSCEEAMNDRKRSDSPPLTSSPLVPNSDAFGHEDINQSLIATVEVNASDEDDEQICLRSRKRTKRQQITSDSENTVDYGDQNESTINNTLSSAFSSQAEILTTQQQEALEGDVAQLHKEIEEFEAKLKRQSMSTDPVADVNPTAAVDSETGIESKQLSEIFVIDESPTVASSLAVPVCSEDDVEEDSDDLFISPASPSPPETTRIKTSVKKPVVSKSKRETDQYLKQFQSPGGTVRTKKSLDFTISKSMLSQNAIKKYKDPSPVPNFQTGHEKDIYGQTSSSVCVAGLEVVDVEMTTDRYDVTGPSSPVILSQNGRHTSQGTGKEEKPLKSTVHRHTYKQKRRDLCFVASGIGKEENIMTLKLVEKQGAKFSTKFIDGVTHVIMKTAAGFDRECDRTLKFFQGVAHRCWIVSFTWVTDSLRAGHLLSEEDYEILGDTTGGKSTNGPKRSRLSQGDLFSDFSFASVGNSVEMPKENLCDIIKACGGVIVDHPLGLLSQSAKYKLIVRCSDLDDMPTSVELDMFNGLYQHAGLLTVMREWVMDSLGSYTLLSLAEYVLNTSQEITVPF